MMSSRHFEGDIMFSTGYGSLFSDETYTTVVFMSFRMSAFICVVCFSTFIYFSFAFNNKFAADVTFLSTCADVTFLSMLSCFIRSIIQINPVSKMAP